MRFLSILKTVLTIGAQAAPAVIGVWNPPLGALVGSVLTSVVQAEAMHGPGNGDKKREAALASMQVALPALLQLLEQYTHRELADDALFADGVSDVQEGLVKILNSFEALSPKTKG